MYELQIVLSFNRTFNYTTELQTDSNVFRLFCENICMFRNITNGIGKLMLWQTMWMHKHGVLSRAACRRTHKEKKTALQTSVENQLNLSFSRVWSPWNVFAASQFTFSALTAAYAAPHMHFGCSLEQLCALFVIPSVCISMSSTRLRGVQTSCTWAAQSQIII